MRSQSSNAELWTDKHRAEKAFALQKIEQRRVQAYQERLLLPDEHTTGLERDAAESFAKRLADTRAKDKLRKRQAERSKGGTFAMSDIRGKTVILGCGAGLTQALAAEFRRYDLQAVANAALADVIVIPSLQHGDIPKPLRFIAILRSSFLLTAATVLPPHAGGCLKFKPALASPRKIYISGRFKSDHDKAYDTIMAVAASLGNRCKWRFIDREAFLDARPNSRTLALATGRELLQEYLFDMLLGLSF